jgi:hypothetical protein
MAAYSCHISSAASSILLMVTEQMVLNCLPLPVPLFGPDAGAAHHLLSAVHVPSHGAGCLNM